MQTLLVSLALLLTSNNATVTEMQAVYQAHAHHISAECIDTVSDEIETRKYAAKLREDRKW